MYPEIRQAVGAYLFDKNEKRYINLSESINILGHKNTELLTLIHKHLDTEILHYPLTISRPPAAVELETKLRNLTGINDGQAVYSSSGSEACDIALSILSDLGPVITLNEGYHGLTGQYLKKSKYDELEYGKKFILSFPNNKGVLEELNELVSHGAKSIIIEELQVEAGIREVYNGFLRDIKEKFPELLVCVDE
ncbi:MAG: aminotransferase class III-fold pyridoxal phosphate-dependent enzyme, partial [Candidatus Micrarchaeaceae archaeon]